MISQFGWVYMNPDEAEIFCQVCFKLMSHGFQTQEDKPWAEQYFPMQSGYQYLKKIPGKGSQYEMSLCCSGNACPVPQSSF